MGRYYEGDIEGKFWFGIQSSDDADFFGQQGFQPDHLEYYFGEEDLPKIEHGLALCLDHLGRAKEVLDDFFEKREGYTTEEVCGVLDIPVPKVKSMEAHKKSKYHYYLMWYARYELGKKIYDRVKSDKFCSFRAEL